MLKFLVLYTLDSNPPDETTIDQKAGKKLEQLELCKHHLPRLHSDITTVTILYTIFEEGLSVRRTYMFLPGGSVCSLNRHEFSRRVYRTDLIISWNR